MDSTAQRAAVEDWSYSHFLGLLLEHELAARKRRQVETNLHFANLPYHKRLSGFDFNFQPSVDPTLIEELSALQMARKLATAFAQNHLSHTMRILAQPRLNWTDSSLVINIKGESFRLREKTQRRPPSSPKPITKYKQTILTPGSILSS